MRTFQLIVALLITSLNGMLVFSVQMSRKEIWPFCSLVLVGLICWLSLRVGFHFRGENKVRLWQVWVFTVIGNFFVLGTVPLEMRGMGGRELGVKKTEMREDGGR